jgi:hypothetical protein
MLGLAVRSLSERSCLRRRAMSCSAYLVQPSCPTPYALCFSGPAINMALKNPRVLQVLGCCRKRPRSNTGLFHGKLTFAPFGTSVQVVGQTGKCGFCLSLHMLPCINKDARAWGDFLCCISLNPTRLRRDGFCSCDYSLHKLQEHISDIKFIDTSKIPYPGHHRPVSRKEKMDIYEG